jgi:hypothetical protein
LARDKTCDEDESFPGEVLLEFADGRASKLNPQEFLFSGVFFLLGLGPAQGPGGILKPPITDQLGMISGVVFFFLHTILLFFSNFYFIIDKSNIKTCNIVLENFKNQLFIFLSSGTFLENYFISLAQVSWFLVGGLGVV